MFHAFFFVCVSVCVCVFHAFNPSFWKAGTGESLYVLNHTCLPRKFQNIQSYKEKLYLGQSPPKKEDGENEKEEEKEEGEEEEKEQVKEELRSYWQLLAVGRGIGRFP